MDFTKDVLPLLGALIVIVVILYLSYIFSKYMAKKVGNVGNSGNIKICERVALGQEKGIAIAQVCDKFYLIGIANSNITLLKELEDYEPPKIPENNTGTFKNVTFKDAFKNARSNMGMGWKVSGKNGKDS